MIKYIFCDVDGCLLPEESAPWQITHVLPLVEWCRANEAREPEAGFPQIVLCTGRPQPYVEALMKLYSIRLPAICESGAVLYTLDDNRGSYGPGVTAERLRGLRQVQAWLEEDVLPSMGSGTALLQFGKMAQISVYSKDHDVLLGLAGRVEEFATRIGLELDVHTSIYYLNVSLLGVNKGKAALSLLEAWGSSPSEAAAIGDTEGDIPLREAVAFFACPSNARPPVKEQADYVASRPMAEGVLEILRVIEGKLR